MFGLVRRASASVVFVVALCCFSARGLAASFVFGGEANGLSGIASKTLSHDGISMSLAVAANLPGAVFNESDARGVTINSAAVPGVTDTDGGTKINRLAGPVATESLTFSFDKAGVIDDILFDGITDDALEFFRLESTGGYLGTFFDFEIPAIVDVSLITEPNIEYIYTGVGFNDDRFGINIPFQAGEVFTLSYGQLDALVPNGGEFGNGGRFGGVNVHVVPEPGSVWLAVAGALVVLQIRRCV
jgi:hypothetical protein